MKKQTSYIGIAKSACALLLCLAMLICMVPPVQVSAADTDASAVFVGEDAETKGAWEGKYGKDTAYLVLYQFDVANANPSANNHNRFAEYCGIYDLMIQSSDSKISKITNATSKAWCWAAEAGDEAVLDMPSGSNLTPFYAYAKDAGATSFTVTTTDETAVHAFTVYGTSNPVGHANYTPRDGITVKITDEDGYVLYNDTLDVNVFAGGKYLTFNVTGSFTFTLQENGTGTKRGGFGVNAVFIDAPQATNATFDTLLAAGGSVSLAEDIETDDPVDLLAGTVLDLNGHKLTAPSVMGAAGSVIDTSSNMSGRIDCAQNSLVLGNDNGYLPVWDGEAFLLTQPRMTADYFNLAPNENGFEITTRPGFGRSNGTNVAKYLASGNSGVKISFVLSWKDVYGNEGTKTFVLGEKLVQDVYQSVGNDNYAFKGIFSNPGDAQWYRVDVKLESCNVVVDSSNIITDDTIKYDNPNDDNKTYLFAHDFNADLAWEDKTLAGKRGSNSLTAHQSDKIALPEFDGTSMILNGGSLVNVVELPVNDIDVGTKIVIEADVTLGAGTGNINWLETIDANSAYSKINSSPQLVSYNNAGGTVRNAISKEFVIRSEIQKGEDDIYTITTSILGTDIQHTVTGATFPTKLIRRTANGITMTLDYLVIYTETTTG